MTANRRIVLSFLSVVLISSICRADQADEIIKAAGIRGGFIVHLDCGRGELTAALGRSGRFVVRGLARSDDAVAEARRHVLAKGIYGRTSIGAWDGKSLPFMDNLVNLIVCDKPPGVGREEIMRALAPRGVLLVGKGKGFSRQVKPWPGDIDEWTHYLHGPDNNAVARDRVVAPPDRLQWIADPIHLRSHEHLNSISALVSAGGRIFYIIDEGPTAAVIASPKWRLVARDAFNGLLLWKSDIGPWEGHFRVFRSGPPETARRLVAVGKRVYVTPGYGKEVAAFDAVSGKIVRAYKETAGALEILVDSGKLFVVTGAIDTAPPADPAKRFYPAPAPRNKGTVALDAESGKLLWKLKGKDTSEIMPTTMAVSGGGVFFQNTRQLIALDSTTGKEKWRADRPVFTRRLSWSAPTLVVCDGVVLSADGATGGIRGNVSRGAEKTEWILSATDIRKHPVGDLVALDAKDGKVLWTGKSLQGFCNPGDLFVVGGKVWAGADVGSGQALLNTAVDIRTGKVLSRRPANGMPVAGHTRCYRNKATERFLLMGDFGVEFVDLKNWSWNANSWVRGTCQYGVMPCNGLLYVPSDSCACRPEMRVHGFTAMAPQAKESHVKPTEQLHRGAAYNKVENQESKADNKQAWPTYRNDAARSGRTKAAVPAEVKQAWQAKIGGQLSSLTVAGGKVFVSQIQAHTVYALDANSGKVVWRRTVGGPVDSPPTVCGDLVIFGCRDGRVYCLRAADGELVWRFRAAPETRSLMAMENIESAWPVHGSVMVRDSLAWFAAGRSSYLGGGIRIYALQTATGKVALTQRVSARGKQQFHTSKPKGASGATKPGMPDILSADKDLVYMRWMGFDKTGKIVAVKPHLFSATGFLDDTWWHRTYWQYGTWMSGGFGGWPRAAQQAPSGRIMVIGDDAVLAFGRSKYDAGNGGSVSAGHIGLVKRDYQDSGLIDHPRNPYRLFSARKDTAISGTGRRKRSVVKYNWQRPLPILVRAMVLADKTLFIAGPAAGKDNRGLKQLSTVQAGRLQAVSLSDGKKLAEHELSAAPVFDGMAAISGRLFVSCVDGSVSCLAGD